MLPTVRWTAACSIDVAAHTDGIIEARGGEGTLGMTRLESAVRGGGALKDLPQRILDEVAAFSGGHLSDDVAILVVAPRRPFPT